MTPDRRASLLGQLARWKEMVYSSTTVRVKDLRSIIGKLAFLRPQITRIFLYLKSLYRVSNEAARKSGDSGRVRLTPSLAGSILWCTKEISHNSPRSLRIPVPQGTLTTDAAEAGSGGILQIGSEKFYMARQFSIEEGASSSNQREMNAVLISLKHFEPILKQREIRALTLESDNSTVVANLTKVKSAQGPLKIVRKIFSLLTQWNIELLPFHRPGVLNTEADALSRLEWMGDFEVKWEPVEQTLREWRVYPTIDLFATAVNHKLPRYVSPVKDPDAVWTDAFSRPWHPELPFIHPAPRLLDLCLKRLREERITAVLLAPMWPSQPWWDSLKRMTVCYAVLGKAEDLLIPGQWMKRRGTKLPPGLLELSLVEYRGL
jgi:ribonuclease HI